MDGRGRHGNHRRGPKTEGVTIACEVCGCKRRYMASELRVRRHIRFCSVACRNKGQVKNLVSVTCEHCSRPVTKRRDHLASQKHVYCSAECRSAARRLPDAKWRNPEAIRQYMRAYTEAHREHLNSKSREWARSNPSKRRAATQRWRARLKGASVEIVDYERILKRDELRCHICRKKVNRSALHFDHVIPLSRGGEHSERNIAVSHGSCNVRKGAGLLTLF